MDHQLWTCYEMETDQVSPAQHKDTEKRGQALVHPQALKMVEVVLQGKITEFHIVFLNN